MILFGTVMSTFKILSFILLIGILYGLIFVPTEETYYECPSCGAIITEIHYHIIPTRKVYQNYNAKADHEHEFKIKKLIVYNWLGLDTMVITIS